MERRGIKAEFLRNHIRCAVSLSRIRLPIVTTAHRVEASVGLLAGDGADGGGFIHPIADKNGALSRHILRLHPLRKLVGNHQRDRTVFYHGGDNLFGQMLLRRQGLRPSGLSDVVGFGDGGADPSGSILFGIFLIRIEGISFLTGTDGAPDFLPFVEGAGMGDFRILRIEKQQVAGFLRGAVRHEMEESPQGIVILEH